MPFVSDIMSTDVTTIPAHETLDRAAQLMREKDVGVLPVIDADGKLVSVVTDRDIVIQAIAAGHDPSKVTVGELPTGKLHTVHAESDAIVAVDSMARHKVRRLPVTHEGKIVGIVTAANLAKGLPADQVNRFIDAVTS